MAYERKYKPITRETLGVMRKSAAIVVANIDAWEALSERELVQLADEIHDLQMNIVESFGFPNGWKADTESLMSEWHDVLELMPRNSLKRFYATTTRLAHAITVQTVLAEVNSKNGSVRWANDPTQAMKQEMRGEWDRWQRDRTIYKYPRDYRKAMLTRFPEAVDGTLKNWMSEWSKRHKA